MEHIAQRAELAPFMGLNDDVKIVHFHGPKPNMIEKFREGGFMKDHVRKLFSLAPEAYEYYLDMFNELEASDE